MKDIHLIKARYILKHLNSIDLRVNRPEAKEYAE